MPDLGTYATEVLTAYGVSLLLIGTIVWLSARKSRLVKAELEKVENG